MKYLIILLLAGTCLSDVTITLPITGEITKEASYQQLGAKVKYTGKQTAIQAAYGQKSIKAGAEAVKQYNYSWWLKYWPSAAYYRAEYRYNSSRDESVLSADIGRALIFRIHGAVGYTLSHIDQVYHMAALKFDIPMWVGKHQLIYRYHCRTDFGLSGDRDYEWWQQWEYKLPVGEFYILRCFGWKNDSNIAFRYQMDRQYGFTEREYGVDINLIFGR